MRSRVAGTASVSVRLGRPLPRRTGFAPAAPLVLVTGGPPRSPAGDLHGRREMEAREGEGLREVGLALGTGHGATGVDLDDDVPVEAGVRQPFEDLGAGLDATAGDEVLVLV